MKLNKLQMIIKTLTKRSFTLQHTSTVQFCEFQERLQGTGHVLSPHTYSFASEYWQSSMIQ